MGKPRLLYLALAWSILLADATCRAAEDEGFGYLRGGSEVGLEPRKNPRRAQEDAGGDEAADVGRERPRPEGEQHGALRWKLDEENRRG